ncbi:hypothetical protein AURDEDRAFT_83748 [Auricularia subglabra TFB-10046 SS5]|nr:hypothetical protein AURDEDRAFT_83748 [Auricularia subglabra TFB-10046 SS5]
MAPSSQALPVPKNEAQLEQLLAEMRDSPVGLEGVSEELLRYILNAVMQTPKTGDCYHWYCAQARPLIKEAATFALRLFAYNASKHVEALRDRLALVLDECCDCVHEFQIQKWSSRETYLGCFNSSLLDDFFDHIDKWEAGCVLAYLRNAVGMPSTTRGKLPLASLAQPVVYHCIVNPALVVNTDIWAMLATYCPSPVIAQWSARPIPPGLFLLLAHPNEDTRTWAAEQLRICIVLTGDHLSKCNDYALVLSAFACAALPQHELSSGARRKTATWESSISSDDAVMWSAFVKVLDVYPASALCAKVTAHNRTYHAVIGHLNDGGAHYDMVLEAFATLLNKLSGDLWTREGDEYPEVVFASIKDNPAFLQLIRESDPAGEPRFFRWLEPFVLSLWSKPSFADIVAKVVSFMCEELQHERFKRWHPMIIGTILAVMKKSSDSKDSTHFKAVRAPFDIHAKTIVNVALTSTSANESWTSAISAARTLLSHVLRADIRDIDQKAQLLSQLAVKDTGISSFPALVFSKPLWQLVFRELKGKGANAMAFIIPIVAQSAMYDELRAQSYVAPTSSAFKVAFAATRTGINEALEFVHKEFEDVIELFVESISSPRTLENMLNQQAIIQPMLCLLFSPSARLQNSAKTIVSQAYGVDGRSDCLRALLEKAPEAGLKALTHINESFAGLASALAEACSLSKTLVICLTDVLDVLCARPGGLLFAKSFVYPDGKQRPTKQIGKLWASMCRALAVVFRRTPSWSTFYENQEMVIWMRDALIYGRDLLAARATLEGAILVADSHGDATVASPRKLSDAGKQMVGDLQTVLTEVINWLRLTDFELLYQSLNLLRAIFECFRTIKSQPAEEPLKKLGRFLDKARQRATAGGDDTTRLSAVDLASLAEDMDSFKDDSDDEVQIIERPIFPPTKTTGSSKKRASSPPAPEEAPARKQAKTAVSRPSVLSKTFPLDPKASKPAAKAIPSTSKSLAQKVATASKTGQSAKQPVGTAPPRPPAAQEEPESFIIRGFRDEGRAAKAAAKPSKPVEVPDSSDGDDATRAALAKLETLQKSPPRERRQIKLLDEPLNAGRAWRPALQDRTNHKMDKQITKLRLKPDLTDLHRAILEWDYDQTGDEPPWKGRKPDPVHVPPVFRDHEEYKRVFEPLLLYEAWAQMKQGKDEGDKVIVACELAGKSFVDSWIEVDISIKETLPQKWYLAETDIVLLRSGADETKKTLAKVQNATSSNHGARELKATLRILEDADPGLQVGTNWQLRKVFSLSTLNREYASLVALPYYDLSEHILQAHPAETRPYDPDEVRRTMKNQKVNEPQAKAILASKNAAGFLLVQGPPGTGKTWTICGMVGAFMSNRPKPATEIQAGRAAAPASKPHPKKILICAPSNAGIDEVAKRLCDGVLDSSGRRVVPNVVRIGVDSSVNTSVKHLTLDYQVERKLAGPGAPTAKNEPQVDTNALRAELASVKAALEQKFDESNKLQARQADTKAVQDQINILKSKRFAISQKLDNARDKQKAETRALDAARRKFRTEVLLEADVICSTLAGAGHDTLETFEFETVVIDEAAQSIELSSLIPLRYGCKRCVMVGDPQQLPPTVISKRATHFKYNQSLFVRIFERKPKAAHLLRHVPNSSHPHLCRTQRLHHSIQYRMHPDISLIPSKLFYGGNLKDGPDMAAKTEQPWHASELLGTYRFFNIAQGHHENAAVGLSLVNRAEVDAALALYEAFLSQYSDQDMSHRIGVISMYKAQINALQRAFEGRYGADIKNKLDFNTVDGFQGQEKDIIILSCVRAGPRVTDIGFVKDVRRLNVSITRARSSLFILGHAATLERGDDTWRQIVEDARARGFLVDAEASTFRNANAVRRNITGGPAGQPGTPAVVPKAPSAAPKNKRPAPEPPAGLMTPRKMSSKGGRSSANAGDRGRLPTSEREPGEISEDEQPPAKRARPDASEPGQPTPGPSASANNSVPRANGVRLDGPPARHNGQPRAPKPRPKKSAAASMFIPKKKPGPG